MSGLSPVAPYDAIFSLGAACGCALHLRRNHLRPMAGPLDWVRGAGTVGERAALVANRFQGWLRPENLSPLEQDPGYRHWRTTDAATGLTLLHDFRNERPFEEEWREVWARYERRKERFLACLGTRQRVLLAWFSLSGAATPLAEQERAVRTLRARFPAAIDLLAIEHDPGSAPLGEAEAVRGAGVFAFRANLSATGDAPRDDILGDRQESVAAILARFRLREEVARAVRRHDRRRAWGQTARRLIAGIIPNRALRQRIRRKTY